MNPPKSRGEKKPAHPAPRVMSFMSREQRGQIYRSRNQRQKAESSPGGPGWPMGIGHLFRSTALSKDAPRRFGEPPRTRCTSLHLEGLRTSDVNPVRKWTHPAGVHSQEVPTGVGFTQTERRQRRGLGKGRARQRFLFREHENVPGTDGGGGGVTPRVSLMPSNRVRLNRVKTVHIISFLRPFFFFN